MKKFFRLFISSKATLVLLLLFILAAASGTFIEEKYDTITAKLLVYNSKWFEILLLLLVINFIGSIKRYNLWRKEKLGGLMFHLAFILLIIGAGVTRYFGFEGIMHIREGQLANTVYSEEPYLMATITENDNIFSHDLPLYLSPAKKNSFHFTIDTKKNGKVEFALNRFIKNAIDTLIENAKGGTDYFGIVAANDGGRENILLKEGEAKQLGNVVLAFNADSPRSILLTEKDGVANIKSPFKIKRTKMPEMTVDTILSDSVAEFKPGYLHEALGTGAMFVYTKFYRSAMKSLTAGTPEQSVVDAVVVDVTAEGQTHEVNVSGGAGYIAGFHDAEISNLNLKMAYGSKEIMLPFSVKLNDFILERYAGSQSPSSFASEVTLVDNRKNINEAHRIFMNNVLDYDGYRFFQSSYDKDELGTVLSVNHDFWGTIISYSGYVFLAIGFVLTLFNRNSRFFLLRFMIKETRLIRKASVTMILFLVFSSISFSQSMNQSIGVSHAERFSRLIVQTNDGRFEPLHTLANDVAHKIARRDKFEIPGRGTMNAMEMMMDMLVNPDFWKEQKIIYVKDKSIQSLIGITGNYAAITDFLDKNNNYKLMELVSTAYRKNPAEQNTFDKEIIKVDERANIVMMMLQGSMMKIFPAQNVANNQWVSWTDSLAVVPLTGSISILNDELQLTPFNYANIFNYYLNALQEGIKTGDYKNADKVCGYIDNIQRQSAVAGLLPSPASVTREIFYNNANIFEGLRNIYAMLSIALLILAFTENLSVKKNKIISIMLNLLSALLIIAFLYHTFGMALRWNLTGHAPWSNGYEALLLIAWASLLAGISFMRYSKITLAATALLAFAILMTAGHSSYDPQLTNLQPVLKSYWLIIHVATLTISYGFLGLGFFLGLINLLLFNLKSEKNEKRLDLLIRELTYINEMNLTIGLFLATLGTFLGGVWANESWGRYWGWDAKETWALIIVITYTIVLHFRLVPKMKGEFIFNAGAVIAFGSVLMTFIGVNYYLSKGMHSYAAGDTPVFPVWAWVCIVSLIALMLNAARNNYRFKKNLPEY